MLRELKAAFDERVEEMAQSYVDVLELKARSGKHPISTNVFLLIAFPPKLLLTFTLLLTGMYGFPLSCFVIL